MNARRLTRMALRTWQPLLFAAVVSGAQIPAAQATMLLEISNIEGDSTEPGYLNSIQIRSFSIGQARPRPQGGGSPLLTLAPLSLLKNTDSASSALTEATFDNQLEDWKLTILKPGQNPMPELTLELCDVYVTSFSVGGATGNDELAEIVEFTYGGYRMGFPVYDATGTLQRVDYSEPGPGVRTCKVTSTPNQLDADRDGLNAEQEALLGTNNNTVDTDGDGLVDGAGGFVSIAAYPSGIDLDGDGFVDGEADYGTDPTSADTDGDGFSDGAELSDGSNPLNPTSPFLAGDINGDNRVDIADVLLGQQILRGEKTLLSSYLERGDVAPVVDGELVRDGVFGLGDLLIIQSKVLNP